MNRLPPLKSECFLFPGLDKLHNLTSSSSIHCKLRVDLWTASKSVCAVTSSRLPQAGTDRGCQWGITEAMLVRRALSWGCLCTGKQMLGPVYLFCQESGSSLGQVGSDVVLFEEKSLPRETEESAPMGLSRAEDRRKTCLFMGKRGLCGPGKCQLKRQAGKFP